MPEFVSNQFNNLSPDHFNPSQFHRADVVDQPLYVITPVFNPHRYRSRWKLYLDFEKYVLNNKEAHLVTIECAFGEREFVLRKNESSRHTLIQVRTKDNLWLKENLINKAISHLPIDWKYACYIDGDIIFARPDWVGETIQQLQHYSFLQMFTQAQDLGPNYEVINNYYSYAYCYHNSENVPTQNHQGYYTTSVDGKPGLGYWHPGFTLAFRREAFDAVGGLIDWGILGGGDTFMMYAITEILSSRTLPDALGENGMRWLTEWQNRCKQHIKKNFGYVEGTIYHNWHGSRKSRSYEDRGYILTKSHFDPEIDIKKDAQGLWQLSGNNIYLRDGIRKYMSRRNEDSIDL
jgi:hypothetical protein